MNTGFARGLRIHDARRGTRASRPRRQGSEGRVEEQQPGTSLRVSAARTRPPWRCRLKHECRGDVDEEQRRAHDASPISTCWSMARLSGGSWSSARSPNVMVLAFPGRRRAHRSVRPCDTIRHGGVRCGNARTAPILQRAVPGSPWVEHLRRGAQGWVKVPRLWRSCCRCRPRQTRNLARIISRWRKRCASFHCSRKR